MEEREKLLEDIFSQLRKIKRKNAIRSRTISNAFGITIAQGHLLFIIDKAGEISVGDISSELEITLSAATQLISALEKKDLVVRVIDDTDKRKINIIISKTGKEYLAKFHEEAMNNIKDAFKKINNSDLQCLSEIFNRLIN